jgi:hypothetical protein
MRLKTVKKMTPIELYVEQIFDGLPKSGRCQNQVTGGWWLRGQDPIKKQKDDACRALRAREWFHHVGPRNVPLLPLSDAEMEDLKYTTPLNHIVECFGCSLRANDWDFDKHPSFEQFASGVLASEYAPPLIRQAKELRKEYPPRRLPGLNPGLCWEPRERTAYRTRHHLAPTAR